MSTDTAATRVHRAAPRVLFLGTNWFGSSARACCYALRRLGCEVADVDVQRFLPQLSRPTSRLAVRLLKRQLIREYNDHILALAKTIAPELVIVFKGTEVEPGTIRALRRDATVCNYYPDTSMFAHGPLIPETLPEYDRVFTTKPFGRADLEERLGLTATTYLPHGYDPEIHRPEEGEPAERERFACDVGVIATHNEFKEHLVTELLAELPDLDLRIWGAGWLERSRSKTVLDRVEGMPLLGTSYAKAIGSIRVNLALLTGPVAGSSSPDETTTRTFEIPASGGFMLHPRTPELASFFTEDEEVACFGSTSELADQIRRDSSDPEQRVRIAAAGYSRCVPAYSYDARMARILEWYTSLQGPREDPVS